MAKVGRVRIGTSGWVYKDWKGLFYPATLKAADWFAYYAERFDTVEINNTFYRLVPESVFAGWRAKAPQGFQYAVKANRLLTHRKKLIDSQFLVPEILKPMRQLGPHLGPVLYQLPPHFRCNPERLRSFLKELPFDIRHVVEFRDPSWYTDEIRDLLDEYEVAFCVHDLKGEGSPYWTTGRFAYIRFHGPTKQAYHHRYGRARLQPWAGRVAELVAGGKDVFAYFNNDFEGAALADARDLLELLARESAVT
jgi:uncharacterized protein YecE (DUF72 family)